MAAGGAAAEPATSVSGRSPLPPSAEAELAVTSAGRASGPSGSRQETFRCTGPGRGSPAAAAKPRQATARKCSSPESSASWVPSSENQRTAEPYSFSWSIVCPAPIARSSGGRSAVSTSSGTAASSASQTAGWRLAAAVPEVQSTATGTPVACAAPSAKKPAERSSTITRVSIAGSRQSASASGVEREPGERTASRTPQRASSSTIAEASAVLRFVRSTGPETLMGRARSGASPAPSGRSRPRAPGRGAE